jgi:hypothetical protein
VVILCTRHDPPVAFEMSPNNHLSGQGCRVCWIDRSRGSTADFIARAIEKHGDQYDYSLSEYGKGNNDKVVILCTRHDPPVAFEMSPSSHLSGHGCPLCNKSRSYSKEAIKWLDYVANQSNPPTVIKHAENGGEYAIRYRSNTYFADGYCAETNTVYEFHGSYWHGDPTVYQRGKILHTGLTAGQLYDETIERENIIKSLGYNLVVMWESEWKTLKSTRSNQKVKRRTVDFIARAVKMHSDQCDCSLSKYRKTCHDIVGKTCKSRDQPVAFEQSPANQGCPVRHSKAAKWKARYYKHALFCSRQLIRDEYSSFHGSYWHGDPTVYQREDMLHSNKTAGQLYDETIERENII